MAHSKEILIFKKNLEWRLKQLSEASTKNNPGNGLSDTDKGEAHSKGGRMTD